MMEHLILLPVMLSLSPQFWNYSSEEQQNWVLQQQLSMFKCGRAAYNTVFNNFRCRWMFLKTCFGFETQLRLFSIP